jgi:hypothetical protein
MQIPTQTDYKIRDLYNRDNKLEYWLNRIEADLDELDKTDMLCLGRYMQDQGRSYYGLLDAEENIFYCTICCKSHTR